MSKSAFERLTAREFVPHELLSLIEEFLRSGNPDHSIRSLAEDDAQTFADVMDEAVEKSELSPWAKKQCLKLLYRTCGMYALLPKAMKVPDCCPRTGVALYRGGYADVWKGKYCGREVAVKVVRTYSNSDLEKILGRFCKEVVTWRTLQHPNVLPLIGVTMSEGQFAMVSNWMSNGNINEFVEANPSANRLKLLGDVARGLIYIHEREMIHGDLKGANILIDQAANARLADFGLLTFLSDPANILPSSSYTQGGTARWMGPELIAPQEFGLKTGRPTKPSDCYALGMVIYETISGNMPFHEDTDLVIFLKVFKGERPCRGARFPESLWEKLEQCWKPHPGTRPSVEDVLQCLERCNLPDTGTPSTGDFIQWTQAFTEADKDQATRASGGPPDTSARDKPIIVRCICGDDSSRTQSMIQCSRCMVWQHTRCSWIGIQPHFCEQCRPNLHLNRSARDNPTVAEQYLRQIERGYHRIISRRPRDRAVGGISGTPEGSRISPYPTPYPSPSNHPLIAYDPLRTDPPQNFPDSPGIEPSKYLSVPVYGASSPGLPPGGIGELGVQPDLTGSLADGGRSSGGTSVPWISTTSVPTINNPDVANTTIEGISESPRKAHANFDCPIPGCGRTFIDHFLLKSHISLHNQEKPFPCRLPGCGKRFATAHNCKRHERLHPNKCEGCGKSFQGVDALNQHLRSEGGQDCHKAHDEAHASDVDNSAVFTSANSTGSDPPDSAGGFIPFPKRLRKSLRGDFPRSFATERTLGGDLLM